MNDRVDGLCNVPLGGQKRCVLPEGHALPHRSAELARAVPTAGPTLPASPSVVRLEERIAKLEARLEELEARR